MSFQYLIGTQLVNFYRENTLTAAAATSIKTSNSEQNSLEMAKMEINQKEEAAIEAIEGVET